MSTRFDVGSATSKLCAHGSRFGSALRAEAPRHPSSSPPGLYFRTTNATGVFWGVVVGTVVGLFIFGNGGFDLLWFTWHIVDIPGRSEEHTSELQSRGHLVCRLLLERKNRHTA